MIRTSLRLLLAPAILGLGIASATGQAPGVTGEGPLRFKLLHGSEILPEAAQAVLKSAHGGFAIDRREGKGQIYFALPGAGILRIAPDLHSVELLDTAPEVKNANMHNTAIWYRGGDAFLSFPGNDVAKIFTTDLNGKLLSVLDAPTSANDFGAPAVSEYFGKGGKFVPTDLAELDGTLYITTGYSALDYVLTARVAGSPDPTWYNLAFGGKGTGPGQFGTGHGVTISPERDRVNVADRPHSELDSFTPRGEYKDTIKLPAGSLPCDIDYVEGLTCVGCLEGPDKAKGAPIYILRGGELVSTLMVKEDLGRDLFKHVHNAVIHSKGGRLYVIAQAWNPGDFAILEQVAD